MMDYGLLAVIPIAAYLLGTLSSAYLLGRIFFRTDLRDRGSGNLGATNAYRVFGPWAAGAIFTADFGKGAVAVLLAAVAAARWDLDPSLATALAGFGVIAGHTWPFYLGFKGGKGVATGAGVILALVGWQIFVILLALFILSAALTRYVSVGSVAISAAFPILLALFHPGDWPLLIFGIVAGGLVIFNHRSNLVRLARRQELKIGEKSEDAGRANA